jgi:hypothetical protein
VPALHERLVASSDNRADARADCIVDVAAMVRRAGNCLDSVHLEVEIEVGESHHCHDHDQDSHEILLADRDCRAAMPENYYVGIQLGWAGHNLSFVDLHGMKNSAVGAVCDLVYGFDVVLEIASVAYFDSHGYVPVGLDAVDQNLYLFGMQELAVDDYGGLLLGRYCAGSCSAASLPGRLTRRSLMYSPLPNTSYGAIFAVVVPRYGADV